MAPTEAARRPPLGERSKSGNSMFDGNGKGVKVWVEKKPPLPTKVGLDTTLNLSNISLGKRESGLPHGTLPSALRQAGATLRTVRGTQRTVRIQHDFDTLGMFLRREREFAQQRSRTCRYPWVEEPAVGAPGAGERGGHRSPRERERGVQRSASSDMACITVHPADGYDAWEEEMQAELRLRARPLDIRTSPHSPSKLDRGKDWLGAGGAGLGGRRGSDMVRAARKAIMDTAS